MLKWRPGTEGDILDPGPKLNDYASKHPANYDDKDMTSKLTEYSIDQVAHDCQMEALTTEDIAKATEQDLIS